MRQKKKKSNSVWRAFAAKHKGHPFLTLDPLYALVEEVINAIKAEIPGFFTPEQELFERSLARTRGNGFFLRREIGGEFPAAVSLDELQHRPALTIGDILHEAERIPASPKEAAKILEQRLAPVLTSDWLPDRQRDDVMALLQELISDFRAACGFKASAVTRAMTEERREESLLRQRQEAYAGWLVMQPRYSKELAALRVAQQHEVARLGEFPRRPRTADSRPQTRCAASCLAFYRRWGLEQLLTWELPLPLPTRFEVVPDHTSLTTEEAALLAIPWYVLRGGLDLRQLARRLRHTSSPAHLRDWILKEPGREDDVAGDRAHQRLFWLYRSYELVLLRRYPDACARNVERLDGALAAVMGRGADLVKKLRQRLTRARKERSADNNY